MSMKDEKKKREKERKLNKELVGEAPFKPKIEQGILISPVRGTGGSGCKYPWPKMIAGDSVWFPLSSYKQFQSLRNASHSWFMRNKPHLKVVTRKEDKDGKAGARIWVIKKDAVT